VKLYVLSPEAERDLDGVTDYLIKTASVRVARYVIRELRTGMRFLGENPGAGHIREDLTDDPVKFWPVFSYLIVYDPEKRPVEIVRVLHGALDIPTIL
jgi:plasmid stabilization system protein ParE